MKTLIAILTFTVFSVPLFAQDLDAARANKTIVEMPNGYVESRDPKTKALAESVNAQRKKSVRRYR